MSVTYYFEGAPIAAPMSIRSNEPYFDSDSLSLRNFKVSSGAQRWELSFSIIDRDNIDRLLIGALTRNISHTMVMPQLFNVNKRLKRPISGAIQVNGSHPIGSSVIASIPLETSLPPSNFDSSVVNFNNLINTFDNSSTISFDGTAIEFDETSTSFDETVNNAAVEAEYLIPRGYFVKFFGHSKVYLLTKDLTRENPEINIYPRLVAPVSNNEELLIAENVSFRYFWTSDNIKGLSFSDGVLADVNINIAEKL
jgi:hypothetical protein